MALLGPMILAAYPFLRHRRSGGDWSAADVAVLVGAALSLALMVSSLPLGADGAAVNRSTLLLQATRPFSNAIVLAVAVYALVRELRGAGGSGARGGAARVGENG
jgi:hypothetical protein